MVPEEPRIYADANIPAGLVASMRQRLHWDVLFVLEHPDLRRARDIQHFRLARQLQRTLLTLDHDYLDDRLFPPEEGAGVIVMQVPYARALEPLIARLDAGLFRVPGAVLPLEGRKLLADMDWSPAVTTPLS
ncbi:MAG: DUF5615 family PIN-like protein [Acidobacteria bacterium]|nr:DUF5615 family PIN-like protein [Acidobacteriota bacterium]